VPARLCHKQAFKRSREMAPHILHHPELARRDQLPACAQGESRQRRTPGCWVHLHGDTGGLQLPLSRQEHPALLLALLLLLRVLAHGVEGGAGAPG